MDLRSSVSGPRRFVTRFPRRRSDAIDRFTVIVFPGFDHANDDTGGPVRAAHIVCGPIKYALFTSTNLTLTQDSICNHTQNPGDPRVRRGAPNRDVISKM